MFNKIKQNFLFTAFNALLFLFLGAFFIFSHRNYALHLVIFILSFSILFLLLWRLSRDHDKNLYISKLDPIIWTWFLLLILSSVWGINPFKSFLPTFSLGDFSVFWAFLSIVIFYLSFHFANTISIEKIKNSIFFSFLFGFFSFLLWQVFVFFNFLPKINNDGYQFLYFYIFSFLFLILTLNRRYFVKEKGSGRLLTLYNILVYLIFLVLGFFVSPFAWGFMILSFILAILFYKKNILSRVGFSYRAWSLIILLFVFGAILGNFYTNRAEMYQDSLSPAYTFEIIKSSWGDDFFFGSGLNNFSFSFLKYRPVELNYSDIWLERYSRSFSFLTDLAILGGFLGLLSYLVLFLAVVFVLFRFIKNSHGFLEFKEIAFFALLLFFSQTLFPINLYLFSLSWIFLGLSFGFYFKVRDDSDIFFKKIQWKENGVLSFFNQRIIISFIFIVLIFVFARVSVYYVSRLMFIRGGESNIEKAILLEPRSGFYKLELSKLYRAELNQEMLKPIRDFDLMFEFSNKAINLGREALIVNPLSVSANEELGIIYRDFSHDASGNEEPAIASFLEAMKLDPSNPVTPSEIAKLYLTIQDTDKAIEFFNKSLALKKDYQDARLGLAKAMILNRNFVQAIDILHSLVLEDIFNAEIPYELGRAYFNIKNYSLARSYFQKALKINPGHSNALYSMGLIYEQEGKYRKSLKYLRQVLLINGNKSDLVKKIKELEDKIKSVNGS